MSLGLASCSHNDVAVAFRAAIAPFLFDVCWIIVCVFFFFFFWGVGVGVTLALWGQLCPHAALPESVLAVLPPPGLSP